MAKTIANVLVGVASMYLRQPNDAYAEWSSEHAYAGSRAAKLYKAGSGDAGSTHLQVTPPTGITLANWTTGAAAGWYTWWYYYQALTGNWVQAEFRFEDPTAGSEGWVEITCVPHQAHLGTAAWLQYDLASDPVVGFGGWGELGIGAAFFDWDLGDTVSTVEATINLLGAVDNCSDWILTRVRFELWEATPARAAWIDSVVINNVAYTVEPGGTAPAMTFSSPGTDIGYTEDGVTVEYNADEADIDVEEETFSIARVITKETATVRCNMAEASLDNVSKAMAGAVRSGSIITLGDGVNKELNLYIVGTSPDGYLREIWLPKVNAMGTVGMSYRKGIKTMVPVTFQALKPQDRPAVIITDNAV